MIDSTEVVYQINPEIFILDTQVSYFTRFDARQREKCKKMIKLDQNGCDDYTVVTTITRSENCKVGFY